MRTTVSAANRHDLRVCNFRPSLRRPFGCGGMKELWHGACRKSIIRRNETGLPVRASNGEAPLVILALGQSNAGNHGNVREVRPMARCGLTPIAIPLPTRWRAARGRGAVSGVDSLHCCTTRPSDEALSWPCLPSTPPVRRSGHAMAPCPLGCRLIGSFATITWKSPPCLAAGGAEARAGASGGAYAAELSSLIGQLRREGISRPGLPGSIDPVPQLRQRSHP